MTSDKHYEEPLWDEKQNSEEKEEKTHNYSSRTFMQSRRNCNGNDLNHSEKDKNQPFWKNSDDNERGKWRNRPNNSERRSNNQKEKQSWGNTAGMNERKSYDSGGKASWNSRSNERRHYDDREKSNWRNKHSNDERQDSNDCPNYSRRSKYTSAEKQNNMDRERPNWANNNRKDFENTESSGWKNKYSTNERRDYNDKRLNYRNNDGSEGKFVMKIGACFTGRVIGRQGSKIRSLEDSSQTKINVVTHEGQETDVEIFGSESCIEKAKELIQELIAREYPSKVEDNGKKESGFQTKQNTNTVEFKEERNSKGEVFINWQELIAASQEEKARRWEKCPPIKKDFYFEDPNIKSMTSDEVAEFRKNKNDIVVQSLEEEDGFVVPNPVADFMQAFKNYHVKFFIQHYWVSAKALTFQGQLTDISVQGHPSPEDN